MYIGEILRSYAPIMEGGVPEDENGIDMMILRYFGQFLAYLVAVNSDLGQRNEASPQSHRLGRQDDVVPCQETIFHSCWYHLPGMDNDNNRRTEENIISCFTG